MLVLARKRGQVIVAGNVQIEVVEIKRDVVRLGITAPQDVQVIRPDAKRQQPRKSSA